MNEPRRFIQVVMGPPQVGKTTLVNQLADKKRTGYYFVSRIQLLRPHSTWLEQQWEVARIKMDQGQASKYLLIIDEIQKINNWSEIVKLLWDMDGRNKRNLKVILLGSSRLLFQQGLT